MAVLPAPVTGRVGLVEMCGWGRRRLDWELQRPHADGEQLGGQARTLG